MLSRIVRARAVASAIVLVVLVMAPNIICWWMDRRPEVSETALVIPIVLLAIFLAVLGKRLWLACLLLAPFAVLAPLEVFYAYVFRRPSSAAIIATIFATDAGETREYLGDALLPMLFCVITCCALAACSVLWVRQADLRLSAQVRAIALLVAVAMPYALYNLYDSVVISRMFGVHKLEFNIHPSEKRPNAFATELTESIAVGYPFGVVVRVAQYAEQSRAIRESARRLASFKFNGHTTTDDQRPHIYVLVIGESSRRDRWQLFGYGRPTNPELSRVQDLVPLPDLVTPWPLSIEAIPQLLTRRPDTDSKSVWNEPSIMRLMQEAGYATYWLSNQLKISAVDTPVSFYAAEAQHAEFVNFASSGSAGGYDERLFTSLRKALADSNRDRFIILHMMGSHLAYDARYPDRFKKFAPTLSDSNDKTTEIERRNNSYDNTILYTDFVLAQVIAILRQTDAITALWYESDHGEILATTSCSLGGHGLGTRFEYQIPGFFWYSDSFNQAYPGKVKQIRENARNKLSSVDTFETLADMASIAFPGHDESRSLFSASWRYRRRVVNEPRQTDFDTASFDPMCGFVRAASR